MCLAVAILIFLLCLSILFYIIKFALGFAICVWLFGLVLLAIIRTL